MTEWQLRVLLFRRDLRLGELCIRLLSSDVLCNRLWATRIRYKAVLGKVMRGIDTGGNRAKRITVDRYAVAHP